MGCGEQQGWGAAFGPELGRWGAELKRQWDREVGGQWNQHRGGPGPWGSEGRRHGMHGGHGRGGPAGPPPWLAGLFGMGQPGPEERRGPRVRRGDVRSAILDVLRAAAERGEQVNGYQVIQQIEGRSGGAWKPSPGSVYPTISQLQDEGLVAEDADGGRRTVRLTEAGAAYVDERAAELAAVWAPFEVRHEQQERREPGGDGVDLKPEIGQVMSAVWQIVTTGSEQQRRAATEVLVDARRRLYGILADGDDQPGDHSEEE